MEPESFLVFVELSGLMGHKKMKCYLCYNVLEESNRTYLGLVVVVTAAFHGSFFS